jgi:hypothetical protein
MIFPSQLSTLTLRNLIVARSHAFLNEGLEYRVSSLLRPEYLASVSVHFKTESRGH